jgi:hypothetical protein
MKKTLVYALPLLFTDIPVAGAATTVLVKSVFSAPISWSTGNQAVTGKSFTVLIDGINTTVTLSTATGTLFAGYSDGGGGSTPTNAGIVGITGGGGAVAGIESRTSELLTITLTPVTDSGITYTETLKIPDCWRWPPHPRESIASPSPSARPRRRPTSRKAASSAIST